MGDSSKIEYSYCPKNEPGKGSSMEIQRGLDFHMQNSVVSLGKFDGIHRGHRLLLERILKEEGISTVFTFGGMQGEQIYTEEEKRLLLEQMGIQREVIFPFTEENKKMSPEQFVNEILWDKMDARFICVGEDFRFGSKRAGDVRFLRKACEEHGCRLQVYPKLEDEQGIISSTRIRELIREGDMKQAAKLLGEPWFFLGEVQHGRALGRDMGMPTANIVPQEGKILPPYGVYTAKVIVHGKPYYGVTNVGKKPTVGGSVVGLETCIFDFDQDIYGEQIIVQLLQFQRSERKFDSLEALQTQMQADKKQAMDNAKEWQDKL